jgi:hypothetical protein
MSVCKTREQRMLDAAERAAYRAHLDTHGAELGEAVRVVSCGEIAGWEVYEASRPGLRLVVRQVGGGRMVDAVALIAGGWSIGGVKGTDLVTLLREACAGRAA